MPRPRLEISRLAEVPESDWDLPQDTVFVRLGCVSCTERVCFSAKAKLGNITAIERNEVRELVSLVGTATQVYQGGTSNGFYEDCAGPCPKAEDIQTATAIINEEYGSTL